MKFYTKMKHWQVFLIVFVIPMIFQFSMFKPFLDPSSADLYLDTFTIYMIVFAVVFFGWLWALGNSLYSRVPATIKMRIHLFRAFLIIPFIYVVVLSYLMSKYFGDPNIDLKYIGVIVLLHLFSMFCILYCLWFSAKAMKSAEKQESVKFEDFVGEFFLIWFFPIGIWIIQPRINKLFNN